MTDWHLLILALRGKGKSYEAIARGSSVSKSAISHYVNLDREPRYSAGWRMLEYAKRYLSDEEMQRCRIS